MEYIVKENFYNGEKDEQGVEVYFKKGDFYGGNKTKDLLAEGLIEEYKAPPKSEKKKVQIPPEAAHIKDPAPAPEVKEPVKENEKKK